MLYGDFYDKTLKWTDEQIEIRGRSLNMRESNVTATGVGGNLVSQHYDFVIADDLVNLENSATRYQAEKVIDWWKRSLSLLEPTGINLIVGCLTKDSNILMWDGSWKKIIDVVRDDRVWSVDEKTGMRKIKRVEAFVPQGKSKILEIKTKRHSLKATPTHPFMTLENGNLVWKRADELKKDDWVVTVKQVNSGYKKRYDGVSFADSDFYWLFGFLMGDGWVSNKKTRNYVCACYGKDEKINRRVKKLLGRYFGRVYKTKFGYYRVDSKKSKILVKLGLLGGSKNKKIHPWIFKSRPSEKREFIKGLISADGCKQQKGRGYRVELANKELIEGLKLLSLTCSVRPTSIFFRSRYCQPPNSPAPVKSETWSIGLVFINPQFKENKLVAKVNLLIDGLRTDRIQSVEDAGEEDVFDLTVEDTHNFIANGYVVHNTRWSYYELYHYLKTDLSDEVDMFKRSAHNPDGSLYFPERFGEKKLAELKKLHGSYIYSAFYENDPIDPDTAIIKPSQIKYFTESEGEKSKRVALLPDNVIIFIAVDPAVTEGRLNDYSGFIITAVDQHNNWYVLEARREKVSVGEMINLTFDLNKNYKPDSISLEVIGQGQALTNSIQVEEDRRGVYLPIVEIKGQPMARKEMRIRSILQPRFERGKIYIKKEQDDLLDELLHFPLCQHDDLIDALSQIEDIAYAPGNKKEKKIENPKSKLIARIKTKTDKDIVDEFLGEDY